MDIKSLYTTVAVADFGSFANAARSLGMSISAVSVQMRALETELGFALFDRSNRPPALTDQGRLFVSHARDMLSRWESLSKTLTREIAGGILRIGAVHTIVSGIVPPTLRRLSKKRPELHIQLTTGLSHELEEKLRRGSIDAALLTEAGEIAGDFAYHRFAQEPLVVICSRSLKGQSEKEVLEGNPYVRFNRQARVAQLIDRALTARGISVRSHMEIDTLDAVVRLVQQGLGVSVVPIGCGSTPFPREVRTVSFRNPPLTRCLGLLELKTNPRGHLADLLFAELCAEVEAGHASQIRQM